MAWYCLVWNWYDDMVRCGIVWFSVVLYDIVLYCIALYLFDYWIVTYINYIVFRYPFI